jgi:hypothetical protein
MDVREINRFFLLACAPFLGMLIYMLAADWQVYAAEPDVALSTPPSIHAEAVLIGSNLDKAREATVEIIDSLEKYYQTYENMNNEMSSSLKIAQAQAGRPFAIFDNRISSRLGKPVRTVSTSNIDLKLYQFSRPEWKGYALKVQLKSNDAMKMTLGQDKIPGAETTLSAANRYGAVAGINAGGFADDGSKRYPLSTTVYNGKYVYGFEPTFDDLTFIGMSKDRKLIGGKFSRKSDLDKLDPLFGATFVPVLLQKGTKQQIPQKWLTSPRRAPRTVVGNFNNDQLLFIVTDGYDAKLGQGATLPELQDLLVELRIRDAYNLDGGGSSSLVFEGQVINKPSDGRLRVLPTHFLFFK